MEGFGFNVGWGGIAFADISKRMLDEHGQPIDGKRLVLDTILNRAGIESDETATFGDAPEGNDKGLLAFPYSFTNAQNFQKHGLERPPYVLKVKESPIEAVHEAIRYLIG